VGIGTAINRISRNKGPIRDWEKWNLKEEAEVRTPKTKDTHDLSPYLRSSNASGMKGKGIEKSFRQEEKEKGSDKVKNGGGSVKKD